MEGSENLKKVIMQVSIASPYWSYYPGQEVPLEDELAIAWNSVGHCKIIEDIQEPTEELSPDLESELTTLGGGWYQVPDGNKFQGKAAAIDYLKNPPKIEEPDGGVIDGDNASEQTDTTGNGVGPTDISTGEGTPQS